MIISNEEIYLIYIGIIMDGTTILISMAGLLFMAYLGVPLVYSLATGCIFGAYLSTGDWDIAFSMMGQTAFGAIREYVLVVISMFTIMGLIMERSGAAQDLFTVANRWLKRIPARLAVATIFANAIFSAVTGVGIASTATFSRIAYPAMRKLNYQKGFALGSVAGSTVLGMLIPPSVLMVVWALLTEQSIAKLYLAAMAPGLILTLLFAFYCILAAIIKPEIAPSSKNVSDSFLLDSDIDRRQETIGALGITTLIVITLGGLWIGWFTATEASSVGMLGSFILGRAKGMKWKDMWQATKGAGPLVAPIMLLIISAQMYSKLLAFEGTTDWLKASMDAMNIGPLAALVAMLILWLILGTLLDSMSTLLLSVPIFWPVAQSYGIDPMVFCLVGILVIEAGILTPPLGMAVFIVKSSVKDDVTLNEIYWGALPYCVITILFAFSLIIWPEIVSWPAKILGV